MQNNTYITMDNPFNDWRTRASHRDGVASVKFASQAGNPGAEEVEQAFANQSATILQPLLGDLLNGKHNLGFEVIANNDEYTRMVGIFGFKTGGGMLFSPAFFINGDIKGGLIYRCNAKQFVPATKDWVKYLTTSTEQSEGEGVSTSKRKDSNPHVQLQRIAFLPPDVAATKAASEEEGVNYTTESGVKFAARQDGTTWVTRTVEDGNQEPVVHHMSVLDYQSIENVRKEGGYLYLDGIDGYTNITPADAEEILKVASSHNNESMATLEDYAKTAFASLGDNTNILAQFMGDTGDQAEKLIEAAMYKSVKFASYLNAAYPGFVDLFEYKKVASQNADITVHFTEDALINATDADREQYYKYGFWVDDKRGLTNTSKIVTKEKEQTFTTCSEAGKCALLTSTGDMLEDVLAIPTVGSRSRVIGYDACCGSSPSSSRSGDEYNANHMVMAAKDWHQFELESQAVGSEKEDNMMYLKGRYYTTTSSRMGMMTGDKLDPEKDSRFVRYPQAGTRYLVYDHDQGAIYKEQFYFGDLKRKQHNKVLTCLIVQESYYDRCKEGEDDRNWKVYGKAITINPECSTSDAARKGLSGGMSRYDNYDDAMILGAGIYFISAEDVHGDGIDDKAVADNPLTQLVSERQFDKWMRGEALGAKYVSIKKSSNGVHDLYSISDSRESISNMERHVFASKLLGDFNLHKNDVYKIAASLDDQGITGEIGLQLHMTEKVAANLRIIDQPMFQDGYDQASGGVVERYPQSFALRVVGDQSVQPPARAGEIIRVGEPSGLPFSMLEETSPDKLSEVADAYNLPYVFEHGVVGTLANAFDAIELVDKYIPNIASAVDSLGRTVFLFYWKTDEFNDAYGKDDMVDLESEITTNFQSLGALYLRLLKKATSRRGEERARNTMDR